MITLRPDPVRSRQYHDAGQWRDQTIMDLISSRIAALPDKIAVKDASGIEPALPSWLADLHEREERFTVLDNDQDEVERFISARTRVLEDTK